MSACMITRIEITGFKTFRNFRMEFSPLTVIAGANASGKSNLFDALHLLSRLAEMELKTAFSSLRGEPIEQFTYYGDGQYAEEMSFVVDLLVDQQVRDNWGGEAKLNFTRLRYSLSIERVVNEYGVNELFVAKETLEPIDRKHDQWSSDYIPKKIVKDWVNWSSKYPLQVNVISLKDKPLFVVVRDGQTLKYTAGSAAITTVRLKQTYISGFNKVETPHILAVQQELKRWQILQLTPEVLNKPNPYLTDSMIQPSGENLAAVLHRIKLTDPTSFNSIRRKLTNLLPSIIGLDVVDDKANQRFIIRVKNSDGREFTSRVLSEGTLRLLVLCVLQYDDQHKGVTCLEEPENGTHPFRLKLVAQVLSDLSDDFMDVDMPLRQVIVNTHSPLLVSDVLQVELRQFVTVWFSQLVTQNFLLNNQRVSIQSTRILPVETDGENRYPAVSEVEKKLSLRQLREYLQHTDGEHALNDLRSL